MNQSVTKLRGGKEYQFNPETKLYLNPETGKSVKDPADRKKRIESNLQYYSHPEADRIIKELYPKESMQESIGYVLKHISQRQTWKTYYKTKDGYNNSYSEHMDVWLHSELFSTLLGPSQYTAIMTSLVGAGILTERKAHAWYCKFTYYKFTDQNFLTESVLKPITLHTANKKCHRYLKWVSKNSDPIIEKVKQQIVSNFGKIDLTESEFLALWEIRYWWKYLPKRLKDKPASQYNEIIEDAEKKYKQAGKACWTTIKRWNDATTESRLEMMHTDKFGNRFHYPFTYLPSLTRAYILDLKGNRIHLVAYDLGSSQPTLIANLMVTEHGVSRDDCFVKAVSKFRIYEYLKKRLKLSSRDLSKNEMMHILYCPANSKTHEKSKAIFPKMVEIAEIYKTMTYDLDGKWLPEHKRHRIFPQKMQRMETNMFKHVWAQLLRENIIFLPIHDAVYIVRDKNTRVRKLKKMIRSILKSFISIPFKVPYKYINR